MWLTLDDDTRSRIDLHWDKVKTAVLDPQGMPQWAKVNFPLAVVVATLAENGWKSTSARDWTGPDSSSWQLSLEPADLRVFFDHFQQLLQQDSWAKLQTGHLGTGITGQMDLKPARKLLQRLLKQEDIAGANILKRIVTAGIWTGSRQQDAGIPCTAMNIQCPLCGDPNDTWLHRSWECQVAKQLQSLAIQSTNKLAPVAIAAVKAQPLSVHGVPFGQNLYDSRNPHGGSGTHDAPMWLRGIVPISHYDIPDPPLAATTMLFGKMTELLEGNMDATGLTFYLDESGGQHASEPLLCRAGWGFAVLDVNSSTPALSLQKLYESKHLHSIVLGGVAANLPGPLQTANRAAVVALDFILSRFTGAFEVVPDSAYLVNGYNSGKHLEKIAGPNADLWSSVTQAAHDSATTVIVRKTTSHLEVKRKDLFRG